MKTNEIVENQMFRQTFFPKDRIAFFNSIKAVNADMVAFGLYANGALTAKGLAMKLAKNNYLESVTEEQAVNEARMLGWI